MAPSMTGQVRVPDWTRASQMPICLGKLYKCHSDAKFGGTASPLANRRSLAVLCLKTRFPSCTVNIGSAARNSHLTTLLRRLQTGNRRDLLL